MKITKYNKYLGVIFMTTLNCCSTNCVNNKNGFCNANEVKIKGQDAHFVAETECESFNSSRLKNIAKMLNSINIINRLQEYNAKAPVISINCTASNCFYNQNGHCGAEHITCKSNEIKNKACCSTFIEAY